MFCCCLFVVVVFVLFVLFCCCRCRYRCRCCCIWCLDENRPYLSGCSKPIIICSYLSIPTPWYLPHSQSPPLGCFPVWSSGQKLQIQQEKRIVVKSNNVISSSVQFCSDHLEVKWTELNYRAAKYSSVQSGQVQSGWSSTVPYRAVKYRAFGQVQFRTKRLVKYSSVQSVPVLFRTERSSTVPYKDVKYTSVQIGQAARS